jgi:hypothetical protein
MRTVTIGEKIKSDRLNIYTLIEFGSKGKSEKYKASVCGLRRGFCFVLSQKIITKW